ncbi:DNA repair protein RadA [Abyssisolibacter fermentans]|uniref:DNA repair protein RadA n=1 Tax=Abyssisolibacter fermentans TaxID=1766203 RepID=UPI0008306988|nr:DNA repair protein RadA [Abyssisolibacter fermentans]
MAKIKKKFVCQECGYETPKWMGRCPSCNQWNTLVEEIVEKNRGYETGVKSSEKKLKKLMNVNTNEEERLSTNINELNRVLGGGIVKGSLILVGGDPGIGKSTLLLQMANNVSLSNQKVLYVSGEESDKQIKIRADRLKVNTDNLYILAENNITIVNSIVNKLKPNVIIIDSIQTVYSPDITSAPGSVSQVREVTAELMRVSKNNDIATFIVGHVTKSGAIAGPRVLEHMVDTVLYFEGERHNTYRMLRAVKNRFGSTNEIGIFEMRNTGLTEIKNPSEVLLSGRPDNASGTIVVPCVEGTRPMLLELQSLVSPTIFGMPRRVATGIDYNRVVLLMAVLEKKVGIQMQNMDIYVNITGGIQIKETAVDLGVICAVTSSFKDKPINTDTVVIGEVGLTGEIRAVSMIDKRLTEANKLGFKKAIIPQANIKGLNLGKENIKIVGASTIREALEIVFGG